MGVSFAKAEANLDAAVQQLFANDSAVRAVGITHHESEFGYRAVRSAAIKPQAGAVNAFAAVQPLPTSLSVAGIPVTVVDAPGEISHQVIIPGPSPSTHATATSVQEVGTFRPLVAGLQIENFDNDVRDRASGALKPGFLIVGTLGCFVKLASGEVAILSNNHVVAAENHGKKGADQIYQPGSLAVNPALDVAQLSRFKRIIPSPAGAAPPDPRIKFNNIDAGIAPLASSIAFRTGYLPARSLTAPHATASASVGDHVFKVGRTTGLTRGTVTSVRTVVGPVGYKDGPSWFQDSIEIEGLDGTLFSDHGDSGSAIVRDSGEIVGLLYPGNGKQTYACPIGAVLTYFKCTLA